MDKRNLIFESIIDNAVRNSINEALNENDEEEGWLGDKVNQGMTAAKSFLGYSKNGYEGNTDGRGDGRTEPIYNFDKRWKAAKSGWKNQNTINQQNEILNAAQTLLKLGFDKNATIGDAMRKARISSGKAKAGITRTARNIYN
jgi:hypothetical protein